MLAHACATGRSFRRRTRTLSSFFRHPNSLSRGLFSTPFLRRTVKYSDRNGETLSIYLVRDFLELFKYARLHRADRATLRIAHGTCFAVGHFFFFPSLSPSPPGFFCCRNFRSVTASSCELRSRSLSKLIRFVARLNTLFPSVIGKFVRSRSR